MGTPFTPNMLDADLRDQVIGALQSKINQSREHCEDYVNESAMRILKKHEREKLVLTGTLFNYWLTTAFYAFLEEKRRSEGVHFISSQFTENGERDIFEKVAAPKESNPHHHLAMKSKLSVIEQVRVMIKDLEGYCSETLIMHLEYHAKTLLDKVKPYQLLNITKTAFHTRVNRCKKKLKTRLMQTPGFQEYWEMIKA